MKCKKDWYFLPIDGKTHANIFAIPLRGDFCFILYHFDAYPIPDSLANAHQVDFIKGAYVWLRRAQVLIVIEFADQLLEMNIFRSFFHSYFPIVLPQ